MEQSLLGWFIRADRGVGRRSYDLSLCLRCSEGLMSHTDLHKDLTNPSEKVPDIEQLDFRGVVLSVQRASQVEKNR